MKIPVNLNGEKTIFDSAPDEMLMKVLNKNKCPSVKCGCQKGFCGACAVLVNKKCIASCKMPVGFVKDQQIITLEYFSKTEEYQHIMEGFAKAGLKLCGYCNAGKIFSAYEIIKMNKIPTKQEITNSVKDLSPCCTDVESLVNGIIYAIQIHNSGISKKIKRSMNFENN